LSKKAEVIPFWIMCRELKALDSSSCDEGDSFLIKRRPETIEAAYEIIKTGVYKADANKRTTSAYAIALNSFLCWASCRVYPGDTHKDCICQFVIECHECKQMIEDTSNKDSVNYAAKYLDKYPKCPISNAKFAKAYRDTVGDPYDCELDGEDKSYSKKKSKKKAEA
jgi:hypothetical protein